MTGDTATRRQAGYRRVLRKLAENAESGVVPTNPLSVHVPSAHMGATIASLDDPQRRRLLQARFDDSARDALNVVKACARPDIVYDFSSETTQVGESFTVTMTFTPRTK